MKLRNKKTGEIVDYKELLTDLFNRDYDYFNSKLHEIQDEWEDYEKSEGYWYIDFSGKICYSEIQDEISEKIKLIGNYYDNYEEAEKAVEKLKAWKRLKDKGFRFYNKTPITDDGFVAIEASIDDEEYIDKDLDLLFGGEE